MFAGTVRGAGRALASAVAAVAAAVALSACGGGSSALPAGPSAAGGRLDAPLSGGGPSVVDAAAGGFYSAPITVAWPKGAPAAGDVLLACAQSQWNVKPSAPAGWTALYGAATGFGTGLFYKIAGGGEPASVTFALPSSGNISAAMVRVAGAAGTAPQWSHVQKYGAAVGTAPIVPSVAGSLPLACFSGTGMQSYSVATGWTLASQHDGTYNTMFERRSSLTTGTTAVSVTATAVNATSGDQTDAYGLIVAPGTAATPPPTPAPTAPPGSTPAVADAAGNGSYVTPITVTLPKGAPAAGDVLLACVESQWNVIPSTPSGWTALSTTASGFGSALFYKVAGAGDGASYVFTLPSSGNIDASVVRLTGAAPSAPQWSHVQQFGAAVATAGIVPHSAGMLPLACFGGVGSMRSYSIASGWTQDTLSSGVYTSMFENRTTATADAVTPVSVAATATGAASGDQTDAYGILIAPASGATPPPGGGVGIAPGSVAFLSLPAAAQSVSAAQTGNTSFSASSTTCAGIATISGGTNGVFSVVPAGVGSCSFTIAGANGQTAPLSVTVTTTTVNSR